MSNLFEVLPCPKLKADLSEFHEKVTKFCGFDSEANWTGHEAVERHSDAIVLHEQIHAMVLRFNRERQIVNDARNELTHSSKTYSLPDMNVDSRISEVNGYSSSYHSKQTFNP